MQVPCANIQCDCYARVKLDGGECAQSISWWLRLESCSKGGIDLIGAQNTHGHRARKAFGGRGPIWKSGSNGWGSLIPLTDCQRRQRGLRNVKATVSATNAGSHSDDAGLAQGRAGLPERSTQFRFVSAWKSWPARAHWTCSNPVSCAKSAFDLLSAMTGNAPLRPRAVTFWE